jgi:2OG-Fe(II) oxygenase superfamily
MPITPRERLTRVLDGSRAPSAFSAQVSVPARDVRLTVAGAGPISFPVKAPQAKRMIATARPARFGRGEQTLMDLSVRDTWEITPDQVTLTGLDWDAILAEVRDELGLPARARLRAEPHALLVYGKGQFFLPHRDSEKDDTMIGTLVVSLPSSHTGGELVIEHNGTSVAYQASADEVSVAAFYADCRHEVRPVRTGYRVTFTCNLLLDSDPVGEVPAGPSAEAGTSPGTSPPGSPGGEATTGSRRTGSSTCWITSTPSAGWTGTGSRAPTPNGPRCCGPPRRTRGARRCSRSPRSRRPGTPSRGGGAAMSI